MFYKYLLPLTLSWRVEQKVISWTYPSKNLHLKAVDLFKDVWPFVTTGHERISSFTSKQNLPEEKLNSQNLIWFYFLEKKNYLQSCVYLILVSGYQKKIYELYLFLFRFILDCPFSKVWTPALWNSYMRAWSRKLTSSQLWQPFMSYDPPDKDIAEYQRMNINTFFSFKLYFYFVVALTQINWFIMVNTRVSNKMYFLIP